MSKKKNDGELESIIHDLREGRDEEDILDDLIDEGLDEDEANDLIDEAIEAIESESDISDEPKQKEQREEPAVVQEITEQETPRSFRDRLSLTIWLVVIAFFARFVPNPFVDYQSFSGLSDSFLYQILITEQFSPFALGITPIISAFVFVEIGVFLFNRKLLRDRSYRAKMNRTSIKLGLLLAFLQGYGIALYFESLELSGLSLSMEPGITLRLFYMLSTCAATGFFAFIAIKITRFGIGNGFAILFLVDFLWEAGAAGNGIVRNIWFEPSTSMISLILFAVPMVAIIWFLTRKHLVSSKLPLRVPTCGTVPFNLVSLVFLLHVSLQNFLGCPAIFEAGSRIETVVHVVLLAVFIPILSFLFYYRRRQEFSTPENMPLFRRAWILTGGFFIGIVILQRIVSEYYSAYNIATLDYVSFLMAIAIALDLYYEFKARRLAHKNGNDLVPIEVHHDVSDTIESFEKLAKDPELHVEEQTYRNVSYTVVDHGPLVIQGLYFRSMLYFFGPYVPLVILGHPQLPSEPNEHSIKK